jgi:hypothetical protein
MKIKSIGGRVGLWCAFLAAGTWVLPLGALFIPTRAAIGVVLRDESDPATAWSGTEIATAWATATGRAYNPSDELLVSTAGADDAPVELAIFKNVNDVLLEVPGSTICWSPLGSVEIDAVLTTDPSEEPTFGSGDDLTISVVPRVIAGATSVAGQPLGYFVATSFTLGGSASGPSGTYSLESVTITLPMLSFASAELALSELARAAAAVAGSGAAGGSGGISCINPNWVGLNGQQCCELKADWDGEIEDCAAQFWNNFLACVVPAAGGVLMAAFGCLATKCKYIPVPFGLTCAKFCVAVVGGGGLIMAAIACYNHARSLERDCVREANRYFKQLFREAGCALTPGALGDAMAEVLADQKLDQGDSLDPRTAE